jgi:hypothetical protein
MTQGQLFVLVLVVVLPTSPRRLDSGRLCRAGCPREGFLCVPSCWTGMSRLGTRSHSRSLARDNAPSGGE